MKALRIMVVDDDAIIAILLSEMLEEMGHEVCALEATEAGAVDAAVRLKPDLLIIDAKLSEGTGISAVRRLNTISPTAHLFVSGDLSGVRSAMPGSAMIQKPYCEADLASGISHAMQAAAGIGERPN